MYFTYLTWVTWLNLHEMGISTKIEVIEPCVFVVHLYDLHIQLYKYSKLFIKRKN